MKKSGLLWIFPILVFVGTVLYGPLTGLISSKGTGFELSGKQLPDISVTSMNLESKKLNSILGPNKTVLVFWATWCEPCVQELKDLEWAQEGLEKNNIKVVLLNYDGGIAEQVIPEVKAWLISQKINQESFFDFKEILLNEYRVDAIPYSLGVDGGGKVQWSHFGPLKWASAIELFEKSKTSN